MSETDSWIPGAAWARCRCAVVPVAPAHPDRPGKLDQYRSRAEHARAHRLRSEIRRRDRRRARTGRPPIRLRGRRPRMLEITNAVAQLGPAFAAAGQAAQRLAEEFEPALTEMQRRINEMVHAVATATVPQRYVAGAGTTPEWTIRDDVRAYQRRVEAELTESGRARRDQALAGPYITVDELRRQMAEAEQQEAERAEHYQRAFERIRPGGLPRPVLDDHGNFVGMRTPGVRSGGFVSPPRDQDDDTIGIVASPGEVRMSADAVHRYRHLLEQLNRPSRSVGEQNERDFRAVARSLGPIPGPGEFLPRHDVTHHDRYLGEGNLERDETSSTHSTDSSGTGAVWSDLMARIDNLIKE